MADDKPAQSLGWFQVEDQMIIALAHAGDVDAAHVHRQRILQQGGSPSPDAYGVLIQNVKDTTDDNTNALALFNEAIDLGVTPNVYLYNTIISKLAKARKADTALEFFRQMKAQSVAPTSVTYGALIAACGRVGDITSAENLFREMSSRRNFRPRVPPYNMMMQLYTQTKPDRERALYYYNAMLDAGIKPTAHTYKVRSSSCCPAHPH
jgi:pentatricopeptide repeat protein